MTPSVFVRPDPARDEVKVAFPSFLPDGNRYLYVARRSDGSSSLMLGENDRVSRVVMPIESNAQYVEPGVLVFARGGALVGQSFNASTGQVAGEPFAIAESVRFFLSTSAADFSASPNGSLVFQSHADRSRLAWLDRSGREVGTVGSPGNYLEVRIEPAGRTALASRTLPATGTYDIWSFDLERGTETRVTLDDAFTEIEGIIVPGGDAMVFAATRGRPPRLMRRDLRTGHDEPLLPQGRMQGPDDVSPDGRRLAYQERTDRGTFNLWTMPLDRSGDAVPDPPSPFSETRLRFAPDGDHYSFTSNESGRAEVYVSRLSGGAEDHGFERRRERRPLESRRPRDCLCLLGLQDDGRSRFGRRLRSSSGDPMTLFANASKPWVSYDLSPDGKRFLVIIPEVVASEQPLTAFLNMLPTLGGGQAK